MRIGWFAAGALGLALAVPAVAQDRVGSGLVGSNQVTADRTTASLASALDTISYLSDNSKHS